MIKYEDVIQFIESHHNQYYVRNRISKEHQLLLESIINDESEMKAILICNKMEIPFIAYLVKAYDYKADKPERLATGLFISAFYEMKYNWHPIKKKTFYIHMNGFKTAHIYG